MKLRHLTLSIVVLFLLACTKKQAEEKKAEAEPHPESVTNWTAKSELFAEYPPLVSGDTSRFAIHLTRLDNFKPVTQGRVEVRLVLDGKTETFATDSPSRPGIFGVDVKPAQSGEYRISIHLLGASFSDSHDLGLIESSKTKQAAIHEHGPETEQKIAFLKEQQWTLDFGTAIVEDLRLKSGIRVAAEVTARSGGEATLVAPVDGRLTGEPLPIAGTRVNAGQILTSVLPPTTSPGDPAAFELAQAQAQAELQLARKDRERAERLVEVGAAPAKRLDEARTVETLADAKLKAAVARLAQFTASAIGSGGGAKTFAVRAPISGFVMAVLATVGTNVKAGDPILKIVDADTVYVTAIVPEFDLPMLRKLSGAELEVPGVDRPRALGKLISVGRVVDPATRTVPVIYETDNRDRSLSLNQAVHIRLLTETSGVAPVVPESAVVDDGGRPILFVQESGETFVRRPVKLGIRQHGSVQVLEGANPGERIVTVGAHFVRLSAMSNQVPAHGHVH